MAAALACHAAAVTEMTDRDRDHCVHWSSASTCNHAFQIFVDS